MNEAETFENALLREKPTDELEQAFRQGYNAGKAYEDKRYREIAYHYGLYSQREQFIEECSEAILASQKCKRTSDNPSEYEKNLLNLAEEIADVLIMARQMRLLVGAGHVDEFIEEKLERQMRRMADES
jgi:NTP pyrophosphatase (non-canonical NTP hydrolase)